MTDKPVEMKAAIVFQASLDPGTTCYAKLIMPDGKFSNFEIDREMAHMMVVELTYHMYLQTGRILNAPRNEV
tara:strand:+ start:3826 stop:4041 length:216 start_codon:yes stop_codon:yes gene_type:complete